MSDVEHVEAYYVENDKLSVIKYEDLVDNNIFKKAQSTALTDSSGCITLQVRTSKSGLRHFYELSKRTGGRREYFSRDSAAHDDRVDDLLKKLSAKDDRSMKLRNGKQGAYIHEYFLDLSDYTWDKEVHRIMSAEVAVRHDLYGAHPALRMSVHRPAIAIEVIDTHYPEDAAFDAMLAASANFPLVVIFDFVKKKNSFFSVEPDFVQMTRWTFYIRNGKVWHNGRERAEITTSKQLKIEYESLIERWANAAKNN